MRRAIHLTFVLITALGVSSLMYSCNEKKQDAEDESAMSQEDAAEERVEEMRDHIRQEREEFIVQARARIEKNKEDIKNLKIVARDKKGEIKADYERSIENLKAENDRLEAKIDENKEAANDKWDNFKEEFNSDMSQLGESIGNLFKDNK